MDSETLMEPSPAVLAAILNKRTRHGKPRQTDNAQAARLPLQSSLRRRRLTLLGSPSTKGARDQRICRGLGVNYGLACELATDDTGQFRRFFYISVHECS